MDVSIGQAIFGTGALVIGGFLLILIYDAVVFTFNPDRGRELMGLQAALIHSIFKSKRGEKEHHRHRRDGEEEPHEHRRKTPTEAPSTIRMLATPPPKRRSGEHDQ